MPTYTYSLADDFPAGTINELQLQTEASADSVSTWGDVVTIIASADPSAYVEVHVPGEDTDDASVTWATSAFQDLAVVLLAPWRGTHVRYTGEYKTGADTATVQLLADDEVVGDTQSLPHSDGSWLPFTIDFPIDPTEDTVEFSVQGQSPLFTTLQIRNARLEVVRG